MQTQKILYERVFPDIDFPCPDKNHNLILSPSGKSLLPANTREPWIDGDLLPLRAGRKSLTEATSLLLSGSISVGIAGLYSYFLNVALYPKIENT
jgi:hypothetical protein